LQATPADLEYFAKKGTIIQIRTVAFVKKWMDNYWFFDFYGSAELQQKLHAFLDMVK